MYRKETSRCNQASYTET